MNRKMNMRSCGIVCAAVALTIAAATVTAGDDGRNLNVGLPSFTNPLWKHEAYDASWMKATDGRYYLVSTEREVLRSVDFVHWELVATDFFAPETLAKIREHWPNIWAPKVMDFTGKIFPSTCS